MTGNRVFELGLPSHMVQVGTQSFAKVGVRFNTQTVRKRRKYRNGTAFSEFWWGLRCGCVLHRVVRNCADAQHTFSFRIVVDVQRSGKQRSCIHLLVFVVSTQSSHGRAHRSLWDYFKVPMTTFSVWTGRLA
jgi:hypothetical protein